MKFARSFRVIQTTDTAKDFHEYSRISFLTRYPQARDYLDYLSRNNEKINPKDLEDLVAEVVSLSDQALTVKIFKLIIRESLRAFNDRIFDISHIVDPSMLSIDITDEEYQNLMMNPSLNLTYRNKYFYALKIMFQSCAGSFLSSLTTAVDPELAAKIKSMLKNKTIDSAVIDDFSKKLYKQLSEDYAASHLQNLQSTEVQLSDESADQAVNDATDDRIGESEKRSSTANERDNDDDQSQDSITEENINVSSFDDFTMGEDNADDEQYSEDDMYIDNMAPNADTNDNTAKIDAAVDKDDCDISASSIEPDTLDENALSSLKRKRNDDDTEDENEKDISNEDSGNYTSKKIKITNLNHIFKIPQTKINKNQTIDKIYNTVMENKPTPSTTPPAKIYKQEFVDEY